MTKFLAVIVGAIIWLPVYLLLGGVRGLGPGVAGWQLLASLFPVGAIAVPALVRASKNPDTTLFLWLLALSPLLAIAGALSQYAFEKLLYGNIYHPKGAMHGALISVGFWIIIGTVVYLFYDWLIKAWANDGRDSTDQ